MADKSKPDAAKISAQLREHRAQVVHIIETGEGTHQGTIDQTAMGRLSRMDALQVQAMDAETERRREEQLRRIDAALQRLEEDEYGWCVTCGEGIAPKRLEKDPAAAQCITCAGKADGS